MRKSLTVLIEKEGDGYVALCPQVDVASQGDTIEAARKNLLEALELFFECASKSEIKRRMHDEVYVTSVDVAVG
jgi:predicted RNase H-like HicB family nuclease